MKEDTANARFVMAVVTDIIFFTRSLSNCVAISNPFAQEVPLAWEKKIQYKYYMKKIILIFLNIIVFMKFGVS